MQEYKRIDIQKDQIVPIAEKMRKNGIYLVMIHAFRNKDGQMDVSYDYAVDPAIESYHVVGEESLPSIGEIYDVAATWPERELNVLDPQGKGQIMVMPMSELLERNGRGESK